MRSLLKCRYFRRAFLWSVPIGGLAGLVGLGGGEFRLPVLTQIIGFPARAAIPLNLLTSLFTLAFALAFRQHVVPVGTVATHVPEAVGLAIGGMISAIYGAALVGRLNDTRLINVMAALLAGIGILLLVEAFVPFNGSILQGADAITRVTVGMLIGLGIGVIASMLGVAGGEFLIPTLLFVFGASIQIAGSLSLLISLAIVSSGLWRYYKAGAIPIRAGPLRIVGGMSAGSLIGAALGGLAVAFAPAAFVKGLLGIVLLAAAAKTANHRG